MTETVQLRLYTAGQIAAWLIHNVECPGLSDTLIDRARAYSIVNNPFVTADTKIISAIFVNDEPAAYTCVFPDKVIRPFERIIYWNTTLYVDPKYEGRGFGCCLIGQLIELYGKDYYDLDGADATVENQRFCGLDIDRSPIYILAQKSIQTKNVRGKLAYVTDLVAQKILNQKERLRKEIKSQEYHLRYLSHVDDATYQFIQEHSEDDLFLRSQDSFNWILVHPFMQESPVRERVNDRCYFSSTRSIFRQYAVIVELNNDVVGFYILRESEADLAIKYLYFEKSAEAAVLYSIAEHILKAKKRTFSTTNDTVFEFVKKYRLYPKSRTHLRSFAHAHDLPLESRKHIQAGDGDNIT